MPTKTPQSDTQKVPKLRFAGFSGTWEEKKLGEVADFRRGSFPQPYGLAKWYDDENGIPFVQVFDVGEDFKLKDGTKRRITDAAKKMSVWVEKGTIVLTIQGSIGRIALTQYDACIDRTLLIFKSFKEPVDKIFFLHIVFLLFEIEKKKAPGGIIKTITKEVLSSFKISLPTLPEQQKIAEFLVGVDEWIENLRGQKENLESYKKGMMQKIFSQGIRFKDDKGKEFPMWVEKKLGEVGETYNGLIGKAGDDFGDGDSFITYKQIFDDSEINIGKFSLVSVDPQEKQNKAQFGDILFTMSSETPHEVGFSSVLLDKSVSPYLNSFSFGLRPNSLKKLDPYFAKLFFRSPLFRKDVVKLAQGSTRYNISKIGFMKIKIMLPTFPEQQKIAEFLGSIDKVLESKQQQITQAEQWKKGLMQGLFV